jgi:hypothetical protein
MEVLTTTSRFPLEAVEKSCDQKSGPAPDLVSTDLPSFAARSVGEIDIKVFSVHDRVPIVSRQE